MDPLLLLLHRLEDGLEVATGQTIVAAPAAVGRQRGERRTTLRLITDTALAPSEGPGSVPLGHLVVYLGRAPYLRPWLEFVAHPATYQRESEEGTTLAPTEPAFVGSVAEARLIATVAAPLGPGGKLYWDYMGDPETMYGLVRGYPTPATRLGALMFEHGFTWFKDWYFPEGFMEGGQKLQGEKPLPARIGRHIADHERELTAFLTAHVDGAEAEYGSGHPFLDRALERARHIRNQCLGSQGGTKCHVSSKRKEAYSDSRV